MSLAYSSILHSYFNNIKSQRYKLTNVHLFLFVLSAGLPSRQTHTRRRSLTGTQTDVSGCVLDRQTNLFGLLTNAGTTKKAIRQMTVNLSVCVFMWNDSLSLHCIHSIRSTHRHTSYSVSNTVRRLTFGTLRERGVFKLTYSIWPLLHRHK